MQIYLAVPLVSHINSAARPSPVRLCCTEPPHLIPLGLASQVIFGGAGGVVDPIVMLKEVARLQAVKARGGGVEI